MLKNYLKTAWRNLKRNKIFSFINVFGLSVGLACCMLICAYVYSELNYDQYPAQAKQMYRVGLRTIENNGVSEYPMVDIAVAQGIKNMFPEVTETTRLSGRGPVFVKYNDRQFKEEHVQLVDPNFLQLFSIPLIDGDNKSCLTDPSGMVITKAMSVKYFGNQQALGKTLAIDGKPYKVTGVIDKVPDDSHFHGDAFLSLTPFTENAKQTWSNIGFFTYIVLDKNADAKKLEAAFPEMVRKFVVPEIAHDMGTSVAQAGKAVNTFLFYLQPLSEIHLHSATKYELEANGDIHYVYIFAALAAFILVLAGINFTNLSTASSAKRSKEVGIRKVLGSEKSGLVSQFLTESVMLTVFALLLALGLVYLLLPMFNNLAGKHIEPAFFLSPKAIAIELFTAFVVGILAGIYPAFFLSSFQIISVLKGNSSTKAEGKGALRSGLIIFQFAVSTALIISTFVVYQQLHFMQNKKLGYDKEQVLVINDTYTLGHNVDAFKNQLLRNPQITSATISSAVPGKSGGMDGTQITAKEFDDKGGHADIHTNIYHVDESYVPTLGLQVIKGRNFYPSFPGDSMSVLVNEALVKGLGWGNADPVGKTIVRSARSQYKVVGVIKDFHYASAKQKIAPLMLLAGHNTGSVILKVKTGDIKSLITNIKSEWDSMRPEAPFSYSFLDEQYASLYASEQQTGKIFTVFSCVALIIASLGLFGLAAFMIRLRVKEIGIRKVLGASTGSITVMLSKEFLKLIVIASVIAFPVTWFAMNKWLQDFAYRISIQWWVFLLAGAIALLVAALTISFQSVKAALANPVKSLRSE
ncbi:putative ABC transport system permease protein [Mucilaginibacter oryzae]|uniref:Putative ABC transport system permease protein n=1 Tax=Mucilaginibacter oryzae TaxID=468058 RepID=A0A316HA99_9SPHI|nr:ABC transporter permease [Mucilaginibacter oryzae]PWK77367.1 putative ABC transport system permease protein [Mucilaginibacter oryzae]